MSKSMSTWPACWLKPALHCVTVEKCIHLAYELLTEHLPRNTDASFANAAAGAASEHGDEGILYRPGKSVSKVHNMHSKGPAGSFTTSHLRRGRAASLLGSALADDPAELLPLSLAANVRAQLHACRNSFKQSGNNHTARRQDYNPAPSNVLDTRTIGPTRDPMPRQTFTEKCKAAQ